MPENTVIELACQAVSQLTVSADINDNSIFKCC